LGFTGTPLRLLWRGKKAREVGDAHINANRATRV